MWIVYLIQNTESRKIYFGITKDLKKRLRGHNNGGQKYTTKNGSWMLIYAEAYRSKSDALLRERRLKAHGSGKVELIKRIKESLLDTKTGEGRS